MPCFARSRPAQTSAKVDSRVIVIAGTDDGRLELATTDSAARTSSTWRVTDLRFQSARAPCFPFALMFSISTTTENAMAA